MISRLLMSFFAIYQPGNPISMIGAHTDSPVLRIKPVSNKRGDGYIQVGVYVLLASSMTEKSFSSNIDFLSFQSARHMVEAYGTPVSGTFWGACLSIQGES